MADFNREHGLLSPARSETSTSYVPNDYLPTPRSHPLPPDSAKRTALINYLDDRVLNLECRYAKSFAAEPSDRGSDAGYVDFNQIISDINPMVDIVWTSATPSIQTPYLLALAGYFRSYMHSFPFSTRSFALARKFDQAFSSLLGPMVANGSTTQGNIMTTEKVRIRSLAEQTRIEMVNVASRSGHDVNAEASDTDDEDDETEAADTDIDGSRTDDQFIAFNLGKVYEKTLEILGGGLNSLPPPEPIKKPTPPRAIDDVEVIDL